MQGEKKSMTEKQRHQSDDSGVKKPEIEDLKRLISVGREKGYLTYDELNEVLPEDLVSSEQLDDMMMIFDEMDIEIVDSDQQVKVVRESATSEAEDGGEDREIESPTR
jgi:RNA polymerase primary sigma factor